MQRQVLKYKHIRAYAHYRKLYLLVRNNTANQILIVTNDPDWEVIELVQYTPNGNIVQARYDAQANIPALLKAYESIGFHAFKRIKRNLG